MCGDTGLSAAKYASIWLPPQKVHDCLHQYTAKLWQSYANTSMADQPILLQQLRGALETQIGASPLLVNQLALAARLQELMDIPFQVVSQRTPSELPQTRVHVSIAFRYGQPSIPSVLQQLQRRRNQRMKLLVIPLYPQQTSSCTASAFDAIFKEIESWRQGHSFSTECLKSDKILHLLGTST